jgi:hypothetical protein
MTTRQGKLKNERWQRGSVDIHESVNTAPTVAGWPM